MVYNGAVMKTYERIERAIDFIEDNLKRDIAITDVADAAEVSVFYFARLFKQILGESIMEYIRKRRLTQASHELVTNLSKPIIDVALDNGYDSQEAFTRAFVRVFNMTPAKYRMRGVVVGIFERRKFDIESFLHNQGERSNKPKLVSMESFEVAGLRYCGNNAKGEIPTLWHEFNKRCEAFLGFAKNACCFGVCSCQKTENSDEGCFEYVAGYEVGNENLVPKDLTRRQVPAGLWLIFEHRGTLDTLNQTYDYIFSRYFPECDYVACGTEIEMYDEKFEADSPGSVMEIWVKVEKKEDRRRMKDFKIRKMDELTVVGMRYQGTNQNSEIPKMWDEFCKRVCEIPEGKLVDKKISWGICTVEKNFKDGDEFDYYAGVEVAANTNPPAGMLSFKVPKGTWVVFEHKGTLDTLGNTYHEIYTKHLPELGKEPDMMELELYDERFVFGSPESVMEILVKIKE